MLDFIVRGGWALWVIVGCSIISLGVTFERWLVLRRANINSNDLLDNVGRTLDTDGVSRALDLCRSVHGPVAETLAIGLRTLLFLENIGKRPEEIEEGITEAMQDHAGHVVEYLERNLTILATVASLAPILGMLGTVFGMIMAFGGIRQTGNLTPEAVSSGIAEALHCTAGGLVVAAMATVEYNYFVSRVNRFVLEIQSAGTTLVERVLERQSATAKNGQ